VTLTLTYENDLERVRLNQRAGIIKVNGHLRPQVIHTDTHTHQIDCSIRTSKVVSKNKLANKLMTIITIMTILVFTFTDGHESS